MAVITPGGYVAVGRRRPSPSATAIYISPLPPFISLYLLLLLLSLSLCALLLPLRSLCSAAAAISVLCCGGGGGALWACLSVLSLPSTSKKTATREGPPLSSPSRSRVVHSGFVVTDFFLVLFAFELWSPCAFSFLAHGIPAGFFRFWFLFGVSCFLAETMVPVHGDRFIPCRSAMDMGRARSLLSGPCKEIDMETASPYQRMLREVLLPSRTRILEFKPKPAAPRGGGILAGDDAFPALVPKPVRPRGRFPWCPEYFLVARGLIDNYFLNVLDWGSSNLLAVALGGTVWVCDDKMKEKLGIMPVAGGRELVTSVSWAPDGQFLALGLQNSDIQLWDTAAGELLRTLRGAHQSRVGALSWNKNHILSSGGKDGMVVNNDVRARSHVVATYRGHHRDVCGLKWSGSGKQLASGSSGGLLHIWDPAMASSSSYVQAQGLWLHRFEDHIGRAVAWCPFQSDLLASGGADDDYSIKFWNTQTGACLNSVDTGSQVSALLWSKNERELLSSPGFSQDQLTLWKYPSMVKAASFPCLTSQVLYMAQSPDGCAVMAAGNEQLVLWNAFGDPKVLPKPAKSDRPGLFASFNHIR